MPNGKTHDIITIIISPAIVGITYYLSYDIKTTCIVFMSYLFASLMFNGDLDTNSKPYNRWWLLKMIWIPYQIIFEHRSIFTHGLFIGTLIRIIYIGIIPFILLILNDVNILKNIELNVLLLFYVGLESGSAIHTISDKLF